MTHTVVQPKNHLKEIMLQHKTVNPRMLMKMGYNPEQILETCKTIGRKKVADKSLMVKLIEEIAKNHPNVDVKPYLENGTIEIGDVYLAGKISNPFKEKEVKSKNENPFEPPVYVIDAPIADTSTSSLMSPFISDKTTTHADAPQQASDFAKASSDKQDDLDNDDEDDREAHRTFIQRLIRFLKQRKAYVVLAIMGTVLGALFAYRR